jgi:hypothetical protein
VLRRIRRLPSPALVISAIALIVAVGGGTFAFAVSKDQTKRIAKNVANSRINHREGKLSVSHAKTANTADTATSVGPNGVNTTAIQDNAVTNSKIADNAVTNSKIADNAVTNTKIADGSVSETKIQDNAVTNTKIADNAVTNTKIADGSVHASELGDSSQVVSANAPIAAGAGAFTSVQCPPGSQVLSGGGGASSFGVHGVESFQAGNGWLWAAQNTTAAAQTIFATAVCLNAP